MAAARSVWKNMGTHERTTHCIAMLQTEVKVLDIELQVRKDELPELKEAQ
jgi:hypothetical protein